MPTFYSRASHCKMIGISENTFKSLRTRGNVPLVSNDTSGLVISELGGGASGEEGLSERQRGYTPSQTYASMIAEDLVTRLCVSREFACKIADHTAMLFHPDIWPRVLAGLDAGEQRDPIFFGYAVIEGEGRFSVFSPAVLSSPRVTGLVAVNAVDIAARLRAAAVENEVDLGDFFA